MVVPGLGGFDVIEDPGFLLSGTGLLDLEVASSVVTCVRVPGVRGFLELATETLLLKVESPDL